MISRNLTSILIALWVSSSVCQLVKPASLFVGKKAAAPNTSTTTAIGSADKEYEAYRRQVLEHFVKQDFSWIDREATKDRLSKERLPGGYWKLRALYGAFDAPGLDPKASDGQWEDLLSGLASWAKQRPNSVTAKVALASAWKGYAWKARGGGYADTVTEAGWEAFEKRLATASQFLDEASSLKETCPHWFVIALWIGVGQGWNRDELEKIFQAGTKLEPAYYYIYQAKASYLLPRWGGAEGEWERFADESALRVGGHQGDIIFFAIYSQMLDLDGMAFMNSHQQSAPKLIAGFRSIEKLYGPSVHRLNEACFFAWFGNDVEATAELFNRIGDNYDESVWRSKQIFELFRQQVQARVRSSQSRK